MLHYVVRQWDIIVFVSELIVIESNSIPKSKKMEFMHYHNGAVSYVHLKNFMGHRDFTWEPGPKINFITGRAESGKTSILQAIRIGLGKLKNFSYIYFTILWFLQSVLPIILKLSVIWALVIILYSKFSSRLQYPSSFRKRKGTSWGIRGWNHHSPL